MTVCFKPKTCSISETAQKLQKGARQDSRLPLLTNRKVQMRIYDNVTDKPTDGQCGNTARSFASPVYSSTYVYRYSWKRQEDTTLQLYILGSRNYQLTIYVVGRDSHTNQQT